MKLKHPQQQGHFCYAIYTAEEAVYSASGLKWSSTRNFKKKLSLQKESPIENHQVASLNCHPCYQITDRAGKWETVLSHRYSSTQRSRIHHGSVGKTQSKPKVTLRLWWRADSSRVPLHSFFFFARGIFMHFTKYIQKPKISLILHSSSWAAKGCVRSHACLFRGFT